MPEKLCILCCENFCPEIQAAVAAEGWADVDIAAFPTRCGVPPLNWDELKPKVPEGCTQVLVFGRACLRGLQPPSAGCPSVRLETQAECFHLVAGPSMVAEALDRRAYLLTPAWLDDWRGNLGRLGFGEENAAGFFQEFARELVLLDTGMDPEAAGKLDGLSNALGLPASRITVGLDYTRLLLVRRVAEWRRENERQRLRESEQARVRERADHLAAMDFLGRLALLKEEEATVAAIEDLFRMLFAPRDFHYVRVVGGVAQESCGLSAELESQVRALDGDWAWTWTPSGSGFLLRLARAGKILGVVVAERFACPEFRDRYLDLALSVAGVCGLAIENARTYQQIKETEEALRRSECSLKMAQAVAHVGHWEWGFTTEAMRWSDETFRILGYQPLALAPSREAFFRSIHPDDRERVASLIRQAAGDEHCFEAEYRVVLPDGKARVVHCIGEMFAPADEQPRMIGIIQDVERQRVTEVLGVIQDITERKELERKLAREARTDALTGCANRRHFFEAAGLEFSRVRRYGGELSMLMLDLDHFKAVNDCHGHHVGDLTLQKLVQVCQTSLREQDLVGRVGGEEFAALLPETGREEAGEVAERLRLAVASAEILLDADPPLRVTASIGVTALTAEDADIEAVLARADQALYAAKGAGRNRVEMA